MAPLAGIVAVLIGINVLFVLVEFALVRVRASKIEVLARRGSARALLVQDILTHLDRYLAAIQVGITLVALALGAFAEPGVSDSIHGLLAPRLAGFPPGLARGLSLGLALGSLAFLQIVLGELVPRTVAIQKAESIALWGAAPIKAFAKLFQPIVAATTASSAGVLRLLGFKPAAEGEGVVSEEELRVLLGETQERGALPLDRLLLLENLFDLGAAKASEVMQARDKIVHLSLNRSWEENLAVIRARRFSRYPLCEDGLDSVIGMVHLKDLLLRAEDGPPDLKRLRRDIAEVAEVDSLEKLIKQFPDKGIHMALVRDRLGRVTGLLTLEDIVEELIGEVHDEFDLPHAWSLMSAVVPSAVVVGLPAEGRRETIALLVDKLAAAEPSLKRDEAQRIVWERELKFSSAVGRGVAVPHGRMLSLDRPLVAVGRFAKPVPFPTPDGVPVRLVFLILTPAATPVIQLKVLGRIASLVTNENLRRKILRAKTSEALVELLRTGDTLLAT